MKEFLEQINTKEFKPSNYTVYCMLEEDGFIDELRGMFNVKYSIEDIEYILIDLSEKEKNGILYRMSFMTNRLKELKIFIEQEIQDDPKKQKSRVFINKEKSFVFIAKLKDFDLHERINKIKICEETEDPSQI